MYRQRWGSHQHRALYHEHAVLGHSLLTALGTRQCSDRAFDQAWCWRRRRYLYYVTLTTLISALYCTDYCMTLNTIIHVLSVLGLHAMIKEIHSSSSSSSLSITVIVDEIWWRFSYEEMCVKISPHLPFAEPRTACEAGRWFLYCVLWWQGCISDLLHHFSISMPGNCEIITIFKAHQHKACRQKILKWT